ncbi:hypothetical protein B0J14DRAFT_695660 [Halenospora varia]|nr:hypothetical protein B0J14DRAFT_695660 [Halenospora varia]
MDSSYKFPGSPGTPLFQVSPDRVNQQRPHSTYDIESSSMTIHRESKSHTRESSLVHEKVAAFNTLAFQGKQLERKANDAALKRAMLGREEAESEMRRYRDETRSLRRQVEEGGEKLRKVSERREEVMENYCKLKETHEHTKAAYEKEIRRIRKDNFRMQSAMVKNQEELKAERLTLRITKADLEQEKERSLTREQEAFAARYQLVSVQEEVAHLHEQVKLIEQERDALRTIAKNEEIARIAAEGQMPLPKSQEDDEFASPKKARKSLDPVTVLCSAASEEEMDDMRMRFEWERQRANRAHDRIEFLELECRLNCCESRAAREKTTEVTEETHGTSEVKAEPASTIFIPEEGVFRRISPSPAPETSPWISPAKQALPIFEPPTPEPSQPMSYARTPSCEPPALAMISDTNTSLLSLLDAPLSPRHAPPTPKQVEQDDEEEEQEVTKEQDDQGNLYDEEDEEDESTTTIRTFHTISTTTRIPLANPIDLTPETTLPADSSNPPLSPTLSREEMLAMIRERRGRAQSLAQGTMTPRKQMVEGTSRRDISAPAIRSGNVRGRSQARV